MGSNVGSILKSIAPVVIGAATGMPWLGAAAGAGLGATEGNGVLPIITGGLGGYGGASLGSGLASAASSAGGIVPAISNGFSNILSGAGSFLSDPVGSISSGLSSVGNRLSSVLSGSGSAAEGGSGLLSAGGSAGGSAVDLSGAGSGLLSSGAPVSASGLVTGGALSGVGGGASSVAAGGGLLSGGVGLSNLLSGVGNIYNQDQAKDDLVKSQQANLAALAPFTENGTNASNALADKLGTSGNTGAAGYGDLTKSFSPNDLQNDPGYQFNLSQGTNALNNQLAAGGMLESGAALKAAQQFGQGLADTTYNNAFSRDQQNKTLTYNQLSGQAGSGLNAANAGTGANTNIGTANANAQINQGNTITGTLSNILSGNGSKQIIGYKNDGTPIYA